MLLVPDTETDVPEVPADPVCPDDPGAPEVPEVPADPVCPDDPGAPEVPEVPLDACTNTSHPALIEGLSDPTACVVVAT